MSSFLYIVATPIGNLEDITLRALRVLREEVALIVAEDTRHSRKLLQHYGIKVPLLSLHEHNEEARSSQILEQYLQQGQSVALISDAGTPLISDPGYRLVALAKKHGVRVVPIPGACAAIAALSVSGLPTDRFVFEGFLPVKEVALKRRLQELVTEKRTLIFYVSVHQLLSVLRAMMQVMESQRELVLAKELTKTFEAVYNGTASEILAWLEDDKARQQGEFVLLVRGMDVGSEDNISTIENLAEGERILRVLLAELPAAQAAKLAARITGVDKKVLYKLAVGVRVSHL
jgi:16S rRNA (cytidine1402-2'-O)-methyltransferase